MALTKIRGFQIQSGTVNTTQIADNAITDAKIANNAVTNDKIANNAVDTDEIANDAVTADKLADTSVSSGSYGSASAVSTFTVDAQGRLTAAADATISITASAVTDFDNQVRTSRLDQMAAPTGNLGLNSQRIINLATPTSDSDAATKAYVDGVAEGLDVKDSVRVATTGNITLSGTQTIDGVAVVADDRVLVKNQTDASENGIYECKAGAWGRADDLAASSSAAGAFTFVEEGTTQAEAGFVCTSNGGYDTVGTHDLAFTQFSGAGSFAANNGVKKTGSTFSLSIDTATNINGYSGSYSTISTETFSSVDYDVISTFYDAIAGDGTTITVSTTSGFLQIFLNGVLQEAFVESDTSLIGDVNSGFADCLFDTSAGKLYFPDNTLTADEDVVTIFFGS